MTAQVARRVCIVALTFFAVSSVAAGAGEATKEKVAAALPKLESYIQEAIDSDFMPEAVWPVHRSPPD